MHGDEAGQYMLCDAEFLKYQFEPLLVGRVIESLAPSGVVLLEAYTVDQIGRGTGGPQVPELLMSSESLSQEFAALEIIHLKELERNVVEGSGHTGLAAVIQFIARKRLD